MAIEKDHARFLAGVRLGRTLGTPIAILVDNRDHANWRPLMSPEPPLDDARSGLEAGSAGQGIAVTIPRPGHADLAGLMKYGHDDVRDVLERASARETVGRVAAGAVCKRLLAELGVTVAGRVLSIGDVAAAPDGGSSFLDPTAVDWEAVETSPVGCADAVASRAMCAAIDEARAKGESLGGVFEIWCWGLTPGLGGYATYEERIDGRLLGALASIPAIKGAQVADAFADTSLPGSKVHDPIYVGRDSVGERIERRSNHAGGLEGGMTNGMPVVLRAAMKPIPTLTSPLPAVDIRSLHEVKAHVERSDVTAVPAARVVGEAMVALVVAEAYCEKFGGDSLEQLRDTVRRYEQTVEARALWRRS
jgi:chorismate synthase